MSHIKQLLRVCINLLSALTVPFFHLLLGDLQFIRLSGGHPVYGPPKSLPLLYNFDRILFIRYCLLGFIGNFIEKSFVELNSLLPSEMLTFKRLVQKQLTRMRLKEPRKTLKRNPVL